MRIRRFRLGAAFALLGVAAGCGKFFISAHDLAAISLSPANPTITRQTSAGQPTTQQFTATGTFGDLSTKDISGTATWSSSSPSIATINSSGLATAVNLGTTTITASSGNLNASTILTVSNTVASAIAIGCGAGSIGCTTTGANLTTGSVISLTATATFSNNTTQDVTTSATWATSNSAVANVNNLGQVTAISAGSATITATFQGATSPAFSVSVIF